jgi:hypothetical protein
MGMVCRFVTHLLRLRFTTTMWRVHGRILRAVPMLFEPVDHHGRWIANAKGDRAGGQPGRPRAGGGDRRRASLRFLESQYLTAQLKTLRSLVNAFQNVRYARFLTAVPATGSK